MTDLRSALRYLSRRRGFVIGAALSLALGMTLATTVFGAVDALFLRPLPFVAPDRLVVLSTLAPGAAHRPGLAPTIPARAVVAARDHATSFAGVAAIQPAARSIGANGDARMYEGVAVSRNFFSILHVAPTLGRLFEQSDEALSSDVPITIAASVWRTRFGSDASIVGKYITVDGESHLLIGVVPDGLAFPSRAAFWTLLPDDSLRALASQGDRYLVTVGRLAAGYRPSRQARS